MTTLDTYLQEAEAANKDKVMWSSTVSERHYNYLGDLPSGSLVQNKAMVMYSSTFYILSRTIYVTTWYTYL